MTEQRHSLLHIILKITDFCNITTYYEEQQLDDSPELLYNFKVYDSRGFTYYLKSVASVLHDSTMKLIAIENKFGDRITYTYDGSLSCITDTYGRDKFQLWDRCGSI